MFSSHILQLLKVLLHWRNPVCFEKLHRFIEIISKNNHTITNNCVGYEQYLFIIIVYQAALGPVTLGLVKGTQPEQTYAEIVLMISVLSIIMTAPTGAILITLSGPRLLTKTKIPLIPEGWRRSHRPSIRDISIIDEEEERDYNIESGHDSETPPRDMSKSSTLST